MEPINAKRDPLCGNEGFRRYSHGVVSSRGVDSPDETFRRVCEKNETVRTVQRRYVIRQANIGEVCNKRNFGLLSCSISTLPINFGAVDLPICSSPPSTSSPSQLLLFPLSIHSPRSRRRHLAQSLQSPVFRRSGRIGVWWMRHVRRG